MDLSISKGHYSRPTLYHEFGEKGFTGKVSTSSFYNSSEKSYTFFTLHDKDISSIQQFVARRPHRNETTYYYLRAFVGKESVEEDKPLYYYLVSERVRVGDDPLVLATRLKLFKIMLEPVEAAATYRQQVIDECTKESAHSWNSQLECLTNSPETDEIWHWRPKSVFIDEEVIIFDYSEYQFKVCIQKEGQPARTLKRGEAYSYAPLQSVRHWFDAPCETIDEKRVPNYIKEVGYHINTTSMKKVLELLYQCPSIRQCWMEYGNLEMLRGALSTGDKELMASGLSAAKVNGISKVAAKLINAIKKDAQSILNETLSASTLINVTKGISTQYNPQVAENFLSTIQSFIHSAPDYIRGERKQLTKARAEEQARYQNLLDCIDNIADIFIEHGGPKGKSYSVERLIEYIIHDVDMYQGIDSPRKALGLLKDYYQSMEVAQQKIKDWFPRSLHLAHDVAARNARVNAANYELSLFKAQTEKPRYQNLEYLGEENKGKDNDKSKSPYVVVLPKEPSDLIAEGTELHHCVGSYVKTVSSGETMICFMRNADTPDTPLVTLEVDPKTNALIQYRGSCNRGLSKEEMDWLKKWCRIKRLGIKSC